MKSTTIGGDVLRAAVPDFSVMEVINTPRRFPFRSPAPPPPRLIMPYNRAFFRASDDLRRVGRGSLSVPFRVDLREDPRLRQGDARMPSGILFNILFIILIIVTTVK